jgi:hypothetical protein
MYNKVQNLNWYQRLESPKGINRFLFYFFLAAVIIVPRWYFVEKFALPLPFWDQWDAEGEDVVRPWVEGRFKLSNFWLPHNEHRVFPTRVLTLLCFKLTGFWSNLNEARLNVLIATAIPVFLVWLMRSQKELYGLRWIMLPVIIAQFILPFGWENILVGFQSQFFFLIFFAASGLALAAIKPASVPAFTGLIAISILSILTMASGILLPFTACGVYIFHCLLFKTNYAKTLVFVLILGGLAVTGYLFIPHVEAHTKLHAANLQQFFDGFSRVASWPSKLNRWVAILLWLPALLGIPILIFRRQFRQFDLFMAACFAWTFAQVLAISYGRGHELAQVTSRYSDLLTLGIISISWFSVRLVAAFHDNMRIAFMMTVIGLTFYITLYKMHKLRYQDDLIDMKNQHDLMLTQIRNVSVYLKTGDSLALDKPLFQIPYPNKERLQQMLDLQTYKSVLPSIDQYSSPSDAASK